jgi:membrane protein
MQIPAKGWRAALWRVKEDISHDRISLAAAGVGFFAFLSLFPAITALLSIYGLVADPAAIAQQMDSLKGVVPPAAMQIIRKQMQSIVQGSGSALSISLIVSVLVALYSASKGANALVAALNIAYGADETRGLIKLTGVKLLMTLTAIVFVIVMFVIIGLPGYLQHIGLPAWLNTMIRIVRWLIVLVLVMAGLALVYALAPSRGRPPIQWVSPGAIAVTLVWLIASIAFSFYISHFGSYNKTYGSAAAIVILMTWFWLSAFLVLIGAAINGELESEARQAQSYSSEQ